MAISISKERQMINETEIKCFHCGINNRIPLYQPSWFDIDLFGKPPSSMYRNDYKISDLLQINLLLGEQNEILKGNIISLMESLKYFLNKTDEPLESRLEDQGVR